MDSETKTKMPYGIRIQVELEGACRGLGFRAGLGAEVVRRDDDRPRSTPEGPEIIPCGVPRRGSKSLLPRRSGGTAATGSDHE